jgi:hypothetical protein
MAVRRNLSDLPRTPTDEGMPPVTDPVIAPVLAQHWFEQYLAAGKDHLPMSLPDREYRASWANERCDRALAYKISNVTPDAPLSLSSAWRMNIGSMVHEALQAVIATLYPPGTFRVEHAVDLRPLGLNGAATADLIIGRQDDTTDTFVADTVVEIKTINGFAFKNCATSFKGAPTGPRSGAIIQGALAAAALNADLRIVYLSLENISPTVSQYDPDRPHTHFSAEWYFSHADVQRIATAEVQRINNVFELLQMDVLPAPFLHDPQLPAGAVVDDPAHKQGSGRWVVRSGTNIVDTGTTWMCGYCDFRDRCTAATTG